jgi:hypothetical protein
MVTNERFEESISKWFEATAPARLPERALDAALERTRGSRQHVGWRSLLERLHLKLPVLALGGVAVVVIAAAIALDLYADHRRVGEAPT